jgi:hypothetical protein
MLEPMWEPIEPPDGMGGGGMRTSSGRSWGEFAMALAIAPAPARTGTPAGTVGAGRLWARAWDIALQGLLLLLLLLLLFFVQSTMNIELR